MERPLLLRPLKKHYSLAGPPTLWVKKRKFQIKFLKKYGLQPCHVLLDFGCGPLRGGIPIIRYLNVGNYYGVDVRREAINEAKNELTQNKLEHKKPVLTYAKNLGSLRLKTKFDFIWAYSLVIHLTDNIYNDFMEFVSAHLKTEGRLLMNVNVGRRKRRGEWRRFPVNVRPLRFYREVASTFGLSVRQLETLQELKDGRQVMVVAERIA